jgi:SAM-dependent methyltransferase
MDEHLESITRVYGPETWNIYARLDESLDPRAPDSMIALAARYVTRASVILDIGCRDASHLIRLVRETGASGVGIDPVGRLVSDARERVSHAQLADRIQILEAAMQALPFRDDAFDVVWCRDVIEVVEPLDAAVAEAARVLRPGGQILVYTVVASDLLQAADEAMLTQSLAVVPANLARERIEAAFLGAGLSIALHDTIGTEWREWLEERSHPAATDLLRLARLRRQREQLIADVGPELYGHVEANLHWSAYQLLGKLLPTLYVLEKPR